MLAVLAQAVLIPTAHVELAAQTLPILTGDSSCMNDVVVYIRLRMHLGLMKTVNYEIMVSKE